MQVSRFSLKTYRRPALHAVLIILSCCAVYANSLYVPFIMDDEIIPSFGKNDFLDILLHRGFRRVTDVTFALNYHLHGIQVTGYHLINLLGSYCSFVIALRPRPHVYLRPETVISCSGR